MKSDKPTQDGNQGEGDRSSVRRYARHLREFVAGDKVEPSARGPEAYVERLPPDSTREERGARRGPHHTRVSVEELMARGHTVLGRLQRALHRVFGRFTRRLRRH